MRFDFEIQIRGEKILINSPQKSYYLEQKNIIAFDRDNKVVAIGQSLDELIAETPQHEDTLRKEIRFETLYTENKSGLENLQIFIVYELARIGIGEMMLSRFLRINSPTCSLVLPNYENIDKESRKQFEYSLFQEGIDDVYINGFVCGWRKSQRMFLKFSRSTTLILCFLLWYLFVLLTDQYNNFFNKSVLILIRGISLLPIYYFLSLSRILILRAFIPHDLLHLDILDQRGNPEGKWIRFLRSLLDET